MVHNQWVMSPYSPYFLGTKSIKGCAWGLLCLPTSFGITSSLSSLTVETGANVTHCLQIWTSVLTYQVFFIYSNYAPIAWLIFLYCGYPVWAFDDLSSAGLAITSSLSSLIVETCANVRRYLRRLDPRPFVICSHFAWLIFPYCGSPVWACVLNFSHLDHSNFVLTLLG